MNRCSWPGSNEDMVRYHDHEWGVPCRDDQKLFEYLVLDAFQAGLSWAIVLKKREGFRAAFDSFNAQTIATYDEVKIQALLQDPSIIRNQAKIRATVTNAQRFLEIQNEFGSFSDYIWSFVGGQTIVNHWETDTDIPSGSIVAGAMSSDISNGVLVARDMALAMKKRGFKFCGTTICYAFMQAAGLVNDHTVSCFRYTQLNG